MTARDRIRLAVDLFGGQRNLARAVPIGDREVRRWCAGESEPSDEALERVRWALIRRGEEIRKALMGWS